MTDVLFVVPLWTDLTAVAIGAVQGAMFAARFRDRQLDWLGVAIIGVVVGLGGGLIRDLLLNQVPASLQSDWYLPVASGAALLGMLLLSGVNKLGPLIISLDALTIGMFGAIGSTKALAVGLPVIPAVFVGVISAVGGSVLRDVMLGVPVALMHVGSLYAVAAGVGTIGLVVLWSIGVPISIAAIACVALTTLIRLLAVRFGWTLPEQRQIGRWRTWRRTPR
ncbi:MULTISPECIES: trimeric intracellular cation channel family protein [unclassified Plantibacter]|uniref:trimeric intracellular cation channel family protein n=1 Tax=unclassified Plantibacter TaxID=2624265 RepID=UPI003D329399